MEQLASPSSHPGEPRRRIPFAPSLSVPSHTSVTVSSPTHGVRAYSSSADSLPTHTSSLASSCPTPSKTARFFASLRLKYLLLFLLALCGVLALSADGGFLDSMRAVMKSAKPGGLDDVDPANKPLPRDSALTEEAMKKKGEEAKLAAQKAIDSLKKPNAGSKNETPVKPTIPNPATSVASTAFPPHLISRVGLWLTGLDLSAYSSRSAPSSGVLASPSIWPDHRSSPLVGLGKFSPPQLTFRPSSAPIPPMAMQNKVVKRRAGGKPSADKPYVPAPTFASAAPYTFRSSTRVPPKADRGPPNGKRNKNPSELPNDLTLFVKISPMNLEAWEPANTAYVQASSPPTVHRNRKDSATSAPSLYEPDPTTVFFAAGCPANQKALAASDLLLDAKSLELSPCNGLAFRLVGGEPAVSVPSSPAGRGNKGASGSAPPKVFRGGDISSGPASLSSNTTSVVAFRFGAAFSSSGTSRWTASASVDGAPFRPLQLVSAASVKTGGLPPPLDSILGNAAEADFETLKRAVFQLLNPNAREEDSLLNVGCNFDGRVHAVVLFPEYLMDEDAQKVVKHLLADSSAGLGSRGVATPGYIAVPPLVTPPPIVTPPPTVTPPTPKPTPAPTEGVKESPTTPPSPEATPARTEAPPKGSRRGENPDVTADRKNEQADLVFDFESGNVPKWLEKQEEIRQQAVEEAIENARVEAEKLRRDAKPDGSSSVSSSGDLGAATAAAPRVVLEPPNMEYDPSTTKAGYCAQGDAFAGIPLTVWRKNAQDGTYMEVMWRPAKNTDLEKVMQWEDEYKKGMKRISTSKVGGDTLKAIAHEENNRLIVLRHKLFCVQENLLFNGESAL